MTALNMATAKMTLGAYTPSERSASVAYGYRGVGKLCTLLRVTFSSLLGVAWISSERSAFTIRARIPTGKAWSMAFRVMVRVFLHGLSAVLRLSASAARQGECRIR